MEEKIYFTPGQLVTLRQDIPNKPTMLVVRKKTSLLKNDDSNFLKGIECRWFTTSGKLQEAVFNTKDLVLINE